MDTIFLRDLRIRTIVGIWEWERRMPQIVSIDLDMDTDIRRAARSDRIEDTLDYKAVSKRLIAFVTASSFGLVETLAERCAALIIDEFGVARVDLKLSKPGAVRGADSVGVRIRRSK